MKTFVRLLTLLLAVLMLAMTVIACDSDNGDGTEGGQQDAPLNIGTGSLVFPTEDPEKQ